MNRRNEDYNKYEKKEIEDFKNQFKKDYIPEKEINEKPFKEKQKMNFKSIASYFYVIISFFLILLIIYIVFDKWLMPSTVHNRPLVTVPDVIGLDVDDAQENIIKSQLTYEITGQQYSEKFKEGTIVNQIPSANSEVKSERPIFLTVSKGKETVIVPYLMGKSLREAKIELLGRGLTLGDVDFEHSSEFPKDTIMEQSINSGKSIPYGSKISLIVSLGSENQVAVPVLIGRRIENVEAILIEHNLKLGNVTYKESETFMANSIIETYPSQNSIVQEGTEINIVVSK